VKQESKEGAMHVMDERISAWARDASREQFCVGPTLDDLGGLDQVVLAADYFANGPFLDYLIRATAQQAAASDRAELNKVILTGLASSPNHGAFTQAVGVLAAHPDLARELAAPLPKILLRRITDAQDAGDDTAKALIGAEAANCLVQLTLAGVVSAARLIGTMDEVTEDAAALPIEFASRLPRLLGVLEAHHPTAGLRNALERCLTPEHTFRDAAFELAVADVRSALEQDSYEAIADGLRGTRNRFAELAAFDPGRLDAQIYRAGIDGLLGLSAPDAAERVAAAADTLRDNLQRYRAWSGLGTSVSWMVDRQNDLTAWSELTALLSEAARYISADNPWYEYGHGIITALSRAYCAHNTVTVITENAAKTIVEVMVAPVIEDAFLVHENRLRFLEHALTDDPDLSTDPDAHRLYAVLKERTSRPASHQPGSVVNPGKARRWHQLARQLPDDFASLVDAMPEHVLDKLELCLFSMEDFQHSITNPRYGRLIERLIDELEQSHDWLPGVAEPFRILLETTIRYAYFCYDVGRTMGGSYTDFLRLRDKGGKKQKVDESLFHQHYREFLATTALFRQVHAEVIDTAGGRADIVVTFDTAAFNVECKIEEEDASEDGLRKYAAQATEYQNTGPGFAILLALDKTVGAEGAVNLFDSIWIERVQRPGERAPRRIVIIRVPGGREAPNQLRPAPRQVGAADL
jgi:hypothetical protein